MFFSRPEVVPRLCRRYGWFDNGDEVTDRYGIPIFTTGKRFDPEYFAIVGTVYYQEKLWWEFLGYIWDKDEMMAQCRAECEDHNQFSQWQMQDILDIFYLLDNGACFNRNVTLPLCWKWEIEAMGSASVQRIIMQFSRFEVSRFSRDVVEEFDGSVIDDDEDPYQFPVAPEYVDYPSDLDSTNTTVDLVDEDDSSFGDPEPAWIFARESPTSVMDTDDIWVLWAAED